MNTLVESLKYNPNREKKYAGNKIKSFILGQYLPSEKHFASIEFGSYIYFLF